MTDRPLSLLTKAMRREASSVIPEDLLLHYEDVYAARFVWEGGPEDMPEDFIERALFRSGLVGPAKAFGQMQVAEGSYNLLGIYGQPLSWIPKAYNAQMPPGWEVPSELPALWLQHIPSIEILPFCDLMAAAWRCMDTSIQTMSQPILLQGTVGAEINVREAQEAIRGFKPMVPTLDRNSVEAKVLDLGGHDYTDSLTNTINNIDCEILARFGIRSPGTEKASGVTPEETLSIAQELRLILERDLRLRRKWCEKVQDLLPGISVRPAPGLLEEAEPHAKETEDEKESGDRSEDTE